MECAGKRHLSTYMSGPHFGGVGTRSFLPAIGTVQERWAAYDTFPAPAPLRRSLTTIPWSPSVYYSTAKVNHTLASEKQLPEPLSYENHLSQLDNIKVPPIFSAARNALYTRYTPMDWDRHRRTSSSDQVRCTGERLRMDSHRMAEELSEKCKSTTADVGKKLGDRLNDIEFWKSELANELDSIIDEIAKLGEARKALENFLKESENQLHIAQECLYDREKRQGIDLVHDKPEKELLTEVDVIRRCQEMARNRLNHANGQMSLNRAAQHELEKDSRDKHIAHVVDSTAFNLKDASRGLALHNGVERIDNTTSVPESWAEFTNGNIKRSRNEREASKNIRNDIQDTLNHISNQLWNQWNKVNRELSLRVQETMNAKNKIQNHLAATLQEIFDTEKNIEFLKKAINDKVNPLKVATTRLETRLHRPNIEACRDPAQSRLVQEVYELDESMETLKDRLRLVESQLQALLRVKSAFEHDLAIKNNSLFIDQEKCMGMRKTYPLQQRVWSL